MIHLITIEKDHAWKEFSDDTYSNICENISSDARYIQLKIEDFTDYFRPKEGKNWCKMLQENCFHQWLSPKGWINLDQMDNKDGQSNCSNIDVYLGGSSQRFMDYFPGDNRNTLPFWGCNCKDHKGGCNGFEWEKSFTLHYAQGKKYIKNRNSNYIFHEIHNSQDFNV